MAPFVARYGIKALRTYLDPTSAVGRAFKVDGLPTSFLIDRQGRVVGQVVGEAKWDSPKMLSIIEPLLRAGGDRQDVAPPGIPDQHIPEKLAAGSQTLLVDRMADAGAGQAFDQDPGGFEAGFGLGQRRKGHKRVLGAVHQQDAAAASAIRRAAIRRRRAGRNSRRCRPPAWPAAGR